MCINNMEINHLSSILGVETCNPVFSFYSDSKGPFLNKLIKNNTIVAEKIVENHEISSFKFDINLEKNSSYIWSISCGKLNIKKKFETEIYFDAPFIKPSLDSIVAPIISKHFTIDNNVISARIYITGLGLYRAFLNEKRIGDSYLTPGYNDYDAYLRYQTYDITNMLVMGMNEVCVHLGDGWYKGRFGPSENLYGKDYLLAVKIEFTLKSNEKKVIYTDSSWTATNSQCFENSIYNGESYDFNIKKSNICDCITIPSKYNVITEINVPIIEKKIIKPTLYISPTGESILDFGQNIVGFVRFKGKFPNGTKIILKHGEVLQKKCFYNANLRSAKAQATYISDGQYRTYEPMFTYFGFRYVLVEGVEKINPDDFDGVVIYSNLNETISCTTSNSKINRLIQNALWGQRGNFLDVPTDCPQRDERLGWTADTQVFVNTACYNMDCRSFYKKYMTDLREDQTRYYNGDIPCFSPSQQGMPVAGGAVWADAATIIPWNLYTFYGDKYILKESYPMMHDYTEVLINRAKSENNNGLILSSFTYGDWLAQDGKSSQSLDGGTDKGFILSAYYYYSVSLAAKAAYELNYADDQRRYNHIAAEIRSAIIDKFFIKTGHFTLDTQTSYVLALKLNLFKDKNKLIEEFKNSLKKDNNKIMTGFTGTPLMLPVLFDNGLEKEAYKILLNEDFPGWLYTVNLGATTIWERWNSLLPDGTISGTDMNSMNHYAFGSVCEAIYSRIAGLKPKKYGWQSAVIEPHFNYSLNSINLSYNSPNGIYKVSWKYIDKTIVELNIHIPKNCNAEVKLPKKVPFNISSGEHSYTLEA